MANGDGDEVATVLPFDREPAELEMTVPEQPALPVLREIAHTPNRRGKLFDPCRDGSGHHR